MIYRVSLVFIFLGFSSIAFATDVQREITINNFCPFDVSLQSTGSNASAIACSPNSTDAQANCPDDFICYDKDKNTSYCVAGTVSATTSLPVSKPADITLKGSSCTSGNQITDSNSVSWGQCTCSTDSQCDSGQVCRSVTKSVNQCYWGLEIPNGGKLAKNSGSTSLSLTPNSKKDTTVVASGKLYAKFACNESGHCLSDNTKGAPATLIEFTLQNNNDWYDVSYINGNNMPASMKPVLIKALDFKSDDPYRCMAAGGTSSELSAIEAYQSKEGLPSNTSLQAFACTNNYASTFDANKKQLGYNFVSSTDKNTVCTKSSECTIANQSCGLTLKEVEAKGTETTCGNRLGYWTYAQLCAVNSEYVNTDLGVDCSVASNYAYALCKNEKGLSDKGPGRSCFNGNTTSKNQSCCGYEAWSSNGTTMPMGKGDSAVAKVDTTAWKTKIYPVVKPIKEGCFLAYSFQYDDPYSTFTCSTKLDTAKPINETSYEITLCPGKHSAGIKPPCLKACAPIVPSGYTTSQFTAAPPSDITLTINACESAVSCTTPVNQQPVNSNVYTGSSTENLYEFKASNKSGGSQACLFTIKDNACITSDSSSAECSTWSLSNAGAWKGRSIGIPDF